MSNKEDWEEIEKWYNEKQEEEKKKYGINLSSEETKKGIKKVNIFVKIINTIGNLFKMCGKLGITIIIIIVSIALIFLFSNIKEKTYVDEEVISTIETRYNIKVRTLNQKIQNKKNGKYTIQRNDIDKIKFTVIKRNGNLIDDYPARTHKYFFDKWESNYKKDFVIEKNFNDDLMNYVTYIEKFANIEDATKAIIDFANYCGSEFMLNWKIFIKDGEVQIYPYQVEGQTVEEIIENVKEIYNN